METVNVWGTTLLNAMNALWTKVAVFVPNLMAFLVIVVAGYFFARLVESILRRVFSAARLDEFSRRNGIRGVLDQANVQAEVSAILGRIVFWLLMLTFMVSATESLGLPRVSTTIDSFVQYLPKVLGAAFILMVGLYVAQWVRGIISSGAENFGLDFAVPLAAAAYGLLVIIVVTLAIGQLELEAEILNQVIAIVLISAGAAGAIAFGFGAKTVAGNILAGTYVRELFAEGDQVTVGGVTGTVRQITAVKTEIQTDAGEFVTIANQDLVASLVTRRG